MSVSFMAFQRHKLYNILFRIYSSCQARQFCPVFYSFFCNQFMTDKINHPDLIFLFRQSKIRWLYRPAVERMEYSLFDFSLPLWCLSCFLKYNFSIFCNQFSVLINPEHLKIPQIIQNCQISPVSRCHCTTFFQPKIFCCMKRSHFNRADWIRPQCYCLPDNKINMSAPNQISRMFIISYQHSPLVVRRIKDRHQFF